MTLNEFNTSPAQLCQAKQQMCRGEPTLKLLLVGCDDEVLKSAAGLRSASLKVRRINLRLMPADRRQSRRICRGRGACWCDHSLPAASTIHSLFSLQPSLVSEEWSAVRLRWVV